MSNPFQPGITAIATNTATIAHHAGETIAFTLTPNAPVAITGTPLLTLSGGATATYDAAHSTATSLVFTDLVAAGQDTADLQVTGLALNGGTVNGQGTLGFAPGAKFATGNLPATVVVADLNGDGKLDLVTPNSNANTVSVLLGDGRGGFAPGQTYATGTFAASVVAADVNGDGRSDLVVSSGNTPGTVAVLLNTGSGFAAPVSYAAGTSSYAAATTDLNGDGRPDVIIAGVGSNGLSVLLGDGHGGFAAPRSFAPGVSFQALALGDLNGDGRTDVVADTFDGRVAVLLGDGTGGFGAPRFLTGFTVPENLTLADLNGDGRPDLVVPNLTANNVSVLLGDGTGGFGPARTYAAGPDPDTVVAADVNGDGKPDLLVTDNFGGLMVLPGDGIGGFGVGSSFPLGSGPRTVVTADLNGDGRPDAIVANYSDNTVSVLLNTSTGAGPLNLTTVATAAGHDTGLIIDTVPPVVAITSPGAPRSTPAVTLTGTVDLNDVGRTVTIRDGATAVGTATVLADGSWSANVGLSGYRDHGLTAAVTDLAGNVGTSAAVTWHVNVAVAGAANGSFNGAAGYDTVSYAASGPVVANLAAGTVAHDGYRDTLTAIHGIIGGPGNDAVTADGAADTLGGGAGNDTFIFANAAQLAAVAGVDGGTGTDTLVVGGGAVTDAAFAHVANVEALSLTGTDPQSVTLGHLAAAAFTGGAITVNAPAAAALTVDGTALGTGTTFTVAAPNAHLIGGAGANTYHLGAGAYVVTGAGTGDVVDPGSSLGRRDATVATNADGSATLTIPTGNDTLSHVGAVSFVDGTLSFDPHGAAAQVLRLYESGLGRAPDEAGAHYWTNAIEHGLALHDLAASCLAAPEFTARYGSDLTDGAFVDQLYHNVLHRDGDDAGRSFWTGALAHGTGRADLLTLFSEGPENLAGTAALVSGGVWDLSENAAEAARMYDTAFGRLPDHAGLAFWRGVLDGGGKLLDMATAAVGSTEFAMKYGALGNRDFVTAEYGNTVHRAPDQAGLDFWTAQLDAGATRAQILVDFSESAEHQGLTAPTIVNADHAHQGIAFA